MVGEDYIDKDFTGKNYCIDNIIEIYYNSRQSFYEKNKDYVKEKAKERLKKLAEENPEKLKQYRRTAYLNQKEKRKQKELEIKN